TSIIRFLTPDNRLSGVSNGALDGDPGQPSVRHPGQPSVRHPRRSYREEHLREKTIVDQQADRRGMDSLGEGSSAIKELWDRVGLGRRETAGRAAHVGIVV